MEVNKLPILGQVIKRIAILSPTITIEFIFNIIHK